MLSLAVSKICLIGMRLILAWDRKLYPFHKLALKKLERAKGSPDGVKGVINRACVDPSSEEISRGFTGITGLSTGGETSSVGA